MIRFLSLGLLFLCSTSSVASPRHSVFNQFLQTVVKGQSVDYRSAKLDHRLKPYLRQLATQAVPQDRNAALAWWINAYNAHTIRRVLLYYPQINSVSTVEPKFAFFDTVDSNVGGKLYSLNQIEHDIIRKEFGDYRIHAALNCASISCPRLQPFAYEADQVDAQLKQVFEHFITDRQRNPGLRDGRVGISSLFKWYAQDFGKTEGLRRVLSPALPAARTHPFEYISYDWYLNDAKPQTP